MIFGQLVPRPAPAGRDRGAGSATFEAGGVERTDLRVFARGGIEIRDDKVPDFGMEGSMEEPAIVEKAASDAGPDGEISEPPDAPSGSVKRFARAAALTSVSKATGRSCPVPPGARARGESATNSPSGSSESIRSPVRTGRSSGPARRCRSRGRGWDHGLPPLRGRKRPLSRRSLGGSGGEAGFEKRTRRIGGDGTDIFRASRLDRTEQGGRFRNRAGRPWATA